MRRSADILARVPLALAAVFGLLCVAFPLGAMLFETVYGPEGFTLAPWATILATDVDRQQILASIGLGLVAVAVAIVFGFGHAWLTTSTDLPGARVLGPLGIAPLVIPPILVAMGFADFAPASGFWFCALLLGTSYAPFVAVMTARGLRAVDGRSYEAAMVARGRGPAEGLVLRSILPEIAAGTEFRSS